MKKLKTFFLISLIAIGSQSCIEALDYAVRVTRDTEQAEIIDYEYWPFNCSGGWIILINGEKIKTRSLPSQDIDKNFRGYVNITLGEKTNECTKNYDYYEIEYIEID